MRKTKVKRGENLKNQKAITLVALVITIIVLLILARSKYCNTYWRGWNSSTIDIFKRKNKRRRGKRRSKYGNQ